MYELINRYEHGMEAAIQMQTQLYNLRVVFEGTRAHTDGNTITLPNVRVFAMHDNITDEQLENARAYFMALRGYAWQQAARIVESDIAFLKDWRSKHGSFALALHNALDDIRIENRFGKSAVGIQEALEYMRETWLWPRYVRKKERGQLDVMYEMLIGLQCMLKHYETIDEHPLWNVLDDSVRSWVRRNQDDLDSAYDTLKMEKRKGTERLSECVERMIARWREEYELVEPLCPKADVEIDSDTEVKKNDHRFGEFFTALNKKLAQVRKEAGVAESEADRQMNEMSELLTDAMKPPLLFVVLGPRVNTLVSTKFDGAYVQRIEPVPASDNKAGWEALSKLAPGERRTVVLRPPDPRLERKLDEAMGNIINEMMNASKEMEKQARLAIEDAKTHIERLPEDQKSYLAYTTQNDQYTRTPDGSPVELKRMRDEVVRYTNVVKNRLQVLLRSRTRTKWRSNRYEGDEIDTNALAEIALGKLTPNAELRPFRERVEADELTDTASLLLVDGSGSMMGQKLRLARWAALCFAEALDLARMRFAVAAFSSDEEHWERMYEQATEADHELYGRFGALYIETCKTFEEPWQTVSHRLPRLCAHNDANYDAESVEWAAKYLLSQRARRRVLFVLSDGLPSTSEPALQQARQQTHLRNVVKSVTAQGVETVGIGICDASVSYYYPQHTVIHTATDLPKAVLNQMDFLLLKRGRR